MGQCNKSLTVADTIMASNKRPIIGKPFMVIFFDITEIIGACCFSNKPKSHRKNEEGQSEEACDLDEQECYTSIGKFDSFSKPFALY